MFTSLRAIFALTNIKKHLSGLLKQPLFYLSLALLALGVGTYAYLNHSTHEAVKTAVATADQNATIKTYQTKEEAERRLIPIQDQEQRKAQQTQKEYTHVRTNIASSSSRNAQAPRLLIDTLNDLERMSRGREDTNAVSDANVRSK